MRNILFISFTIALMLGVLSCSRGDDFKLRQSVFVPDKKNPGLPKYSDWGYNTFGAYIDRKTFVSDEVLPIKIIVQNDSYTMKFKGEYNKTETSLNFVFPKASFPDGLPKKFFELTALNEKKIDFKKAGCLLVLERGSKTDTLKIIKGGMQFKSVKKLYVDKEPSKTILSGKFDFQAFLKGEPISILNGRFDFGIDDSNFYILDKN